MKQYCRYCCYLITGNGIYCIKRENTLSESAAKAANKCRDFSYNPQDAFMENEKDISQDRPKRSSVTDRLRWGGRMTEQETMNVLEKYTGDTLSPVVVEAHKMAITALEEIQQYRTIGTVEECREAVEKQQAKKPELEGDGYADGHMVYDTWICPCCGISYKVDYDDYKYCPDCGQHIDWGE